MKAEVRKQEAPLGPSVYRYYRYEMLLSACVAGWAITAIWRKMRTPGPEPPGFKFFRGKYKAWK
jgi:hypothetical protein